MSFNKKIPNIDLGELNVENIFVTDFLPLASGTNVKVYLTGLMFAQSDSTDYQFDNRMLARTLSLPLQDVLEAWKYWEKQGIIKCYPSPADPQDIDIEFLSLREVYIQTNFLTKGQNQKKSQKNYKDSSFIKDSELFKDLCKRIEAIIGYPLKHSEYREISDFYEHYYKDTRILIRAFEYNYQTRNIRNFKAIKTLLNQWLDASLSTIEEVEHAIDSQSKRYIVYKEILKMLGMSFRMPNQGEKELIDRWLDDYGILDTDLYAFIAHFSKSTLTINFNYIESRLKRLVDQQITSFEAYKSHVDSTKTHSASSKNKNQHIMEKEKTYTEDELESMLLKKNYRD